MTLSECLDLIWLLPLCSAFLWMWIIGTACLEGDKIIFERDREERIQAAEFRLSIVLSNVYSVTGQWDELGKEDA